MLADFVLELFKSLRLLEVLVVHVKDVQGEHIQISEKALVNLMNYVSVGKASLKLS